MKWRVPALSTGAPSSPLASKSKAVPPAPAATRTMQREGRGTMPVKRQVIRAMRNTLIHAYFEVDPLVLWTTIEQDLPPLLHALRTLIAADP